MNGLMMNMTMMTRLCVQNFSSAGECYNSAIRLTHDDEYVLAEDKSQCILPSGEVVSLVMFTTKTRV